jgi:ankyrin repeat protein
MVENSDLEIWNLHRAARENRTDIARVLIAAGDDIDAKNNGGDTPLPTYTRHGRAVRVCVDI